MYESSGPSPVVMIIYLAVCLVAIVGTWKVYTKAGQPGWGVLIPIYNTYLWLKIVGRPGWWLVLLLIPVVNIVILIIICMDLATVFGKGAGYGIGILLLGFIFIPVLGFGDATYRGAPVRA